jgi:hypothetical protein
MMIMMMLMMMMMMMMNDDIILMMVLVRFYSQDVGEDALRSVTIWTALDRTTIANGALQVVPGSHVRGRLETRPWYDSERFSLTSQMKRKEKRKENWEETSFVFGVWCLDGGVI